MKIYKVRLKKHIVNDPEMGFTEIYLYPSVAIGRIDQYDPEYKVNNYGRKKKATVYYIGIVWLSQAYAIEFWCDRKEVA